MEGSTKFIMGIDPGETTGYCLFNSTTEMPIQLGSIKKEEIWAWIDKQNPHIWIVEDYKIRPNVKRWDSGFALQVIGAIKFHAEKLNATVILQQPSIKPVASGLSGYEYTKGKKNMHATDAILHVVYYMHRQKNAKA